MILITSRNAPIYQSVHPAAPMDAPGIPFNSAEEAWFWFICAVEAREDGGAILGGRTRRAQIERPCEPIDIYRILDRLYRTRRLLWLHMEVLNTYGRRRAPPEPERPEERKDTKLWREAMKELDAVLQRRGIVRDIFQREISKMRGVETL